MELRLNFLNNRIEVNVDILVIHKFNQSSTYEKSAKRNSYLYRVPPRRSCTRTSARFLLIAVRQGLADFLLHFSRSFQRERGSGRHDIIWIPLLHRLSLALGLEYYMIQKHCILLVRLTYPSFFLYKTHFISAK